VLGRPVTIETAGISWAADKRRAQVSSDEQRNAEASAGVVAMSGARCLSGILLPCLPSGGILRLGVRNP
jgi:hypothetical protein